MMSFRRLILSMVVLAAPVQAQETWPPELIDPGPILSGAAPADLIVPLPCGGGMAFQRVTVPTDIDNPLSDRPFRMGQSNPDSGFSDYLRPTHLRGPFIDREARASFFFIARYEMNVAQYRAITGDCDAPFTRRDQFAQGDLSWFDAVDLTRALTEWMMANARDALPAEGDRIGFLRLPTEVEWEYATRGGIASDPSLFLGRRFFGDGELSDFAHYQAPGQGRGKLRPVGIRSPNALGLFDLYGNAEELMLEPYRLNAVGRSHGQAGGLVTRGGSIDTEERDIYTAHRREYPMFSSGTGAALVGTFFGIRPVISAHIVNDADYVAIQEGWIAEAEGGSESTGDPMSELTSMLETEVDPRRKEALSALQLEFRVAREAAEQSLAEAAKSTLLSGAAFVDSLIEDSDEVSRLQYSALGLRDLAESTPSGPQRDRILKQWGDTNTRIANLRSNLLTYLLSYRSALETLTSDIGSEERQGAFDTLKSELEGSGQTELLTLLTRFWEDLAAYGETPDMSENELLLLAIDAN